jgi:hypothetical protein
MRPNPEAVLEPEHPARRLARPYSVLTYITKPGLAATWS